MTVSLYEVKLIMSKQSGFEQEDPVFEFYVNEKLALLLLDL